MFAIATELAQHDPIYEPMAVKYFEHFLNMAHAMTNMSGAGIDLWDEAGPVFLRCHSPLLRRKYSAEDSHHGWPDSPFCRAGISSEQIFAPVDADQIE